MKMRLLFETIKFINYLLEKFMRRRRLPVIDKLEVLIANWYRFLEQNPEVKESIQEGYEVGAYDEETGMIIAITFDDETEGKTLRVHVIEDAHVIRKQKE
jgi:hypothetical protein